MLQRPTFAAVVLALAATHATASDVALEVRSNGATAITAAPGSVIPFDVNVELCDASTLGLAAISADLTYDGGTLQPFAEPTQQPLVNFASPLGLANPQGFGGTSIDGDLIQVGGAQNTINQGFAAQPTGVVALGVAQPGSGEVLGSGALLVPNTPGTYTVTSIRARANVIPAGASGVPFWEVEPVDVVVTPLIITVQPTFSVDVPSLSLASGGTASFSLDAGPANAGRLHLILGSLAGSQPGTPFGAVNVPLVLDGYTLYTINQPASPPLVGAFGALGPQGTGNASFTLPPATNPALAGLTAHHAYVLLLPQVDFASNAVGFDLLP